MTPDETPQADLVTRAAGGDTAAFAALVEAHWQRWVSLARSVAGEAEAEDLVQDTLVHLWPRLGELREAGAFGGWVTRAVLRRALRWRHRFSAWLPLSAAPEPRSAGPGTAGLDAARLLALLAPRQRAVLHLTAVDGLSDSEIGSLLDIAPASVRAHRRRAREALARHLTRFPHPALSSSSGGLP
jgi:RNA polymerase sigma-70 factor, ECF subfamily